METSAFTNSSPPGVSAPISSELLCVGCGYNLRGLGSNGRCPECNTPIRRSARGDRLEYADPLWLDRVHRGVATFQGAALGVMALVMPYSAGMFNWIFQGVCALVMLVGVWMFTALDPRLSLVEQPLALRRLTRWAALTAIAVWPLHRLAFFRLPAWCAAAAEVIFVLAFITSISGGMAYVGKLVERVPDAELAGRASRHARWCLVFVGPVILLFHIFEVLVPIPGWLSLPFPLNWIAILLAIGTMGSLLYLFLLVAPVMKKSAEVLRACAERTHSS
ncbi:MAG TPA: hypothetical protein VGM03_15160 [Phycisphaerae bacterium]|jgi:hypothetical protein